MPQSKPSNQLSAEFEEIGLDIQNLLLKANSIQLIKERFLSILEFSPQQQSLSTKIISNRYQPFVHSLEVFGTKGFQRLVLVQFERHFQLTTKLLRIVIKSVKTVNPDTLFLFMDIDQANWQFVYPKSFDFQFILESSLGAIDSGKRTTKSLDNLVPSYFTVDLLEECSQPDNLLLDTQLWNYAKQLNSEDAEMGVNLYYRWWCELVAGIPILTGNQERELIFELAELWPFAQRTDRNMSSAARVVWTTLILANLRLVVYIQNNERLSTSERDLMDCIQEGNYGLMVALMKYDCRHGSKFITYANHYIRASMIQYFMDKADLIRIPIGMKRDLQKINTMNDRLLQGLGRSPSEDELARETQIHISRISNALSIPGEIVPMDELEECFCDHIKYDPNEILQVDYVLVVEHLLSRCNQREKEILCKYYGVGVDFPMTLEEIGEIFGLTRERIRQIKNGTIRRLKRSTLNELLILAQMRHKLQ